MKKFKLAKILFIAALSLLIATFLLDLISLFLTGDISDVLAVICLVALFAFFAVMFTADFLLCGTFEVAKNKRKYKKLPYAEVKDYKAEIELMRQSFAADGSKNKNEIPKPWSKKNAEYYDFGAIMTGRVCYGALVMANNKLLKPAVIGFDSVLPAVFVYSPDPYYDEHPMELRDIAEAQFANRENSVLKNESGYFSNLALNDERCGGRAVYMTTVLVYRPQLPTGYITSPIVPLIADPNAKCTFVLDEKYWSHDFACNFANCANEKKLLEGEAERYDKLPLAPVDYSSAFTAMSEKFYAEMGSEERNDDEPFGELGVERVENIYELSYAYVLSVDKKLNRPLDKHDVIPAVILYGTDDGFKGDPQALKVIADRIMELSDGERAENFGRAVDYKNHTISEVRVPSELTDGREVYLTGALLIRGHLPKFCVSNAIIPVVKLHDGEELIYSVHKDFWGDELISEFVHGKFYGNV